MTPRQALQYLDSFINYELHMGVAPFRDIKLERMRHLLELAGRPQDGMRILHVAGTKGKGSVCAFAAHVLAAMGFRTGLYTSPHLVDVNERIRLLGGRTRAAGGVFTDMISGRQLADLLERMRPLLEQARVTPMGSLTYFEALTALALVFFRERNAEYVVLETGLGGRLDATNVCRTAACAITPVGLEHTRILGERLDQIAGEKAAIIKVPGQPVVMAPQEPEARAVIAARIRQVGAVPVYVGKDLSWRVEEQSSRGQVFRAAGPWGEYTLISSLPGEHQAVNALTALGLVWAVEGKSGRFREPMVRDGVAQTRWPGRFEVIGDRCPTVMDSAHTPLACRALARTVREVFPDREVVLVLGVSADKDIAGICRALAPVVDRVVLTASAQPRAYRWAADDGKEYFTGRPCEAVPLAGAALKRARELAAPSGIVLVTGSIFLVGELRAVVTGAPAQASGAR